MKLGQLHRLAKEMPRLQGPDLQQKMHEQLLSMGLDPGNLYQELEMTSHFVDTHQDTSYSNAPMQLHSHTFYELLYCRNSCGAEYLVGSERYRLQRGDIIFVPPGVSHRPLLPEHMAAPYKRYVVWLSPEFLELYAQMFLIPISEKQAAVGLLRTGGTQWESLEGVFRAGVMEAEQQAEGWEAAVVGNTMQLLSQIRRATLEHSLRMPAETPILLDRLTAYIEENYVCRITLETLAEKFFVSSSTISHLFKEKLGVSVYRYVTQRRLIAAKSLIEKGALLETVAVETGFADYSGFYRAFRQEFGISPRQYRNLQDKSGKVSLGNV